MDIERQLAEARAPYARVIETAREALRMVAEAPEVGTSYNCTEADALAEGMRVLGLNPDGFLSTHAGGDDDGDGHRVCLRCDGNGRVGLMLPRCPDCNGAGWLPQDGDDDDEDDAPTINGVPVPEIPADFPVQPLDEGERAGVVATCGECGLSWDDSIPTSLTPVPAGRCPFEYFHAEKG